MKYSFQPEQAERMRATIGSQPDLSSFEAPTQACRGRWGNICPGEGTGNTQKQDTLPIGDNRRLQNYRPGDDPESIKPNLQLSNDKTIDETERARSMKGAARGIGAGQALQPWDCE